MIFSGNAVHNAEEEIKETQPTYESAKGEVTIYIKSGKDVPKMDLIGSCDSYIVFKAGKCKPVKTKVIKNTLTPVWNEEIKVGFSDINDTLDIQMWDEDAISIVGDDYIGRVKYPLKDFTKKQTLTVKFPEIKKLEPKVEMDFEITKIPK